MHLVKTHKPPFRVLDSLRVHLVTVLKVLVHFKMSQQSQLHFLVLVKRTKCSLRIDPVFSRNLHKEPTVSTLSKPKITVIIPIICQE